MKKISDTCKELEIDFVFPIEIKDSNGNTTYEEDSDGFWRKYEYDANGNTTYEEDSDGFWWKAEYDDNGNQTYYEDEHGIVDGTPRSKSCDGKVVEIDGKKYELKLKN